jgi:chemotaxis response regulator CheB
VVLSGAGTDGADGTRRVRESGGLTFVQSPETAEFRGMPDAAVAVGRVHRALRADRIGEALKAIVIGGRGRLP